MPKYIFLYFKYIFYWQLVQFYSQKRQSCISSNPLGTRSIMDMPQFELIGKLMFDILLVITEHVQFLYYGWGTMSENLSKSTARSLLRSNLYFSYFLKMYFGLGLSWQSNGKSNWITLKKCNLYFVTKILFQSNWSNTANKILRYTDRKHSNNRHCKCQCCIQQHATLFNCC